MSEERKLQPSALLKEFAEETLGIKAIAIIVEWDNGSFEV